MGWVWVTRTGPPVGVKHKETRPEPNLLSFLLFPLLMRVDFDGDLEKIDDKS